MALRATPFQLFFFFFDYLRAHVLTFFKGLSRTSESEENVAGKVVVITGCNSGLGKYSGEEMAKRGAIVVMGCRNMTTGKEAQDDIKQKSSSDSVELYELNLSDMSSIRAFAAAVLKSHPIVDILINNAGISLNDPERSFTKDGFEMHMGTNHLGHFLLTNLLLESLKQSPMSRVVTMSSTACVMSNIDLNDLMMENTCLGLGYTEPYNNSKFANALFTKELAKRTKGTNVKAYSVCPGLAKTQIFRHYSPGIKKIMEILSVFGIPVEKGADSILMCSLSKDVVQDSGKFFRFGKRFNHIEKLFTDEMSKQLWEISENLVKLQ